MGLLGVCSVRYLGRIISLSLQQIDIDCTLGGWGEGGEGESGEGEGEEEFFGFVPSDCLVYCVSLLRFVYFALFFLSLFYLLYFVDLFHFESFPFHFAHNCYFF